MTATNKEPCPTCGGGCEVADPTMPEGYSEDLDGYWIPCPACNGSGVAATRKQTDGS